MLEATAQRLDVGAVDRGGEVVDGAEYPGVVERGENRLGDGEHGDLRLDSRRILPSIRPQLAQPARDLFLRPREADSAVRSGGRLQYSLSGFRILVLSSIRS